MHDDSINACLEDGLAHNLIDTILVRLHFPHEIVAEVRQASDVGLGLVGRRLAEKASNHDRRLATLQAWHLVVDDDQLVDTLVPLDLRLHHL